MICRRHICPLGLWERSPRQVLNPPEQPKPKNNFTVETETDDKLPFLDVQTIREKETQTLRTEVFRKALHTDRYLHYRSLPPPAYSICKNEESRKAEQ